MSQIAVITIDVINSSTFPQGELEGVMTRLENEVAYWKKQNKIAYHESFRGDSMQMILPYASDALQVALSLRTAVNSMNASKSSDRGNKIEHDIRAAIGVGETRQTTLNKMTNEEPFVRSGKKLDQIHKEGMGLGVTTGNDQTDGELHTELFLLEGIHSRWTAPVAELVYHKLQGKTEQVIADELKISQSAVNQRSRSAYWSGISLLLKRYETLIKQITHG